jgi:hypothetical protein
MNAAARKGGGCFLPKIVGHVGAKNFSPLHGGKPTRRNYRNGIKTE